MSAYSYQDGILREEWDDVTRIHTVWDATGAQLSTRPYTTAENAAADAAAQQQLLASNKSTVQTNLAQDLDAMQAIIDETNADLRTDPSQELKDIARAMRRSIRMALQQFDGTS